jgi:APA family basic amino acid/polyamine antiporter
MSISPALDRPPSMGLLAAMGAAMTPVMFAYGGWQTATFMSGELRDPKKHLARGLLIGVAGVVALYMLVNFVYVGTLGADGLAQTTTPASSVMRTALGERGAMLIGLGISISTLGFLSQSMLTAPRVYFAMAEDGLFFKELAWIHPLSRVPVIAIAVQGILAIVIALTGRYEQLLNYVVTVDFIGFGLTAATIFVFRRRNALHGKDTIEYKVPLHPVTTVIFIGACALVVLSTIYQYPENSAFGIGILILGIPVYFIFKRWLGGTSRG